MARRSAIIPQADATRLLKAAKAAGYERARFISHPDGRLEVVAENTPEAPESDSTSQFERWKRKNANPT